MSLYPPLPALQRGERTARVMTTVEWGRVSAGSLSPTGAPLTIVGVLGSELGDGVSSGEVR